MDTGRVDPWVGLGRVRILGIFGGLGRVEISENALCEFCSFCSVSGRNCNEKCTLAH